MKPGLDVIFLLLATVCEKRVLVSPKIAAVNLEEDDIERSTDIGLLNVYLPLFPSQR